MVRGKRSDAQSNNSSLIGITGVIAILSWVLPRYSWINQTFERSVT